MAEGGVSKGLFERMSGRRTESGFSMVEMLMAAFIMAIGLLGLAALQVSAVGHGTTSRKLGTATYLAHGLLDQIQAEGATTSAERYLSSSGLVATNGRAFQYLPVVGNAVDPTSMITPAPQVGPSYTVLGLTTTDPYYTVSTSPGYTVDKSVIFTTSWTRNTGILNAYAKTAIQEFTVNVAWDEYNPQSKATVKKYFSVSRYVRM